MSDVIVVGGGTSGFAAAVAAARAGASVSLLEQTSYLGGTMTGGLVPGIVSLRHQPWRSQETLVQLETLYSGEQIVRGIAQELVDRLVRVGGAYGHEGEASVRVLFDPEIAKWVIDEMAREAGVKTLFYTKVTGVNRDGARVSGVRFNYGETLDADVVIDATGDGHVAYLAGAPYEQGEGGDVTYVQPISLYFLMGGVDQFADIVRWTLFAQIEAEDRPTTLNLRAHNSLIRPVFRSGRTLYDTTMHNVDMAFRVDATDSRDLSEAISAMRAYTVKMAEYFRKYVPGYENSYLLQIADSVGVRETRRIRGDYMLTGEDVLEARTFNDSIGYCGGAVDIHDVEGGRERTRMSPIRGGRLYQIPYRILLPLGIDGLLVAGRCVSADRVACGSIRQQAGCIVTGQAAGVAAALASRQHTQPRDVPIGDIQGVQRDQGAVI